MPLRVLTWNLMHGRAVPPAGHDLLDEFTAALGRWMWDVALLQEVPPWWPGELGRALGAEDRMVLTSRNGLLPLRRAVAVRWPDLIKSNGGGSNAILVRSDGGAGGAAPVILDHRTRRLCWTPERRWVHAVRIDWHGQAVWVGNLHATVHDDAAAVRDGTLAAATLHGWAGGEAAILGGDFNVRRLSLPGFTYAGGHDVDYVFLAGRLRASGEAEVLDRGRLSDHAPVAVDVTVDRAGESYK